MPQELLVVAVRLPVGQTGMVTENFVPLVPSNGSCNCNLSVENASFIGRAPCWDTLESCKLDETPTVLSTSSEFIDGIGIDGWMLSLACVHSKSSCGGNGLLVTLWSTPDKLLASALPEKTVDKSLFS